VRVEVRLYATFAEFAPTHGAGDPFHVELEPTATLTNLIGKLGIPASEVHLCIVNGRPIHHHALRLREADRVGLFPPVGGG